MLRKRGLSRVLSGLTAIVLLAGITSQVFFPGKAHAAASQITSRKLTLEDGAGATNGGSKPGATVNHFYTFTLNSGSNVGTMVFQYCTTAAAVSGGIDCVAPTGIDTNAVTLGANTGLTGWSSVAHEQGWDDANDLVNNAVQLNMSSAVAVSSPQVVTLELDNIVNPSATNTTFFVRIWTFATTSITYVPASGAPLDTTDAADAGTVAASTARPIVLTGTMPESLIFCTGHYIDISGVTGLPDCTTATTGNVSFNQLFDPNTTSWATSQMAASTNAGTGYAITVSGHTLESGSNQIAPMTSSALSVPGTSQFGMNLIDDYAPTVSQTVANGGAAIVTDPTIGNGSADPVKYLESDGVTPDPNGAKIFPVSDVTNFFANQATGGFKGQGDLTNNYPEYVFNTDITDATVVLNDVAQSDAGGTLSPTNSQRYTATYIVNVPGNQPAGGYTTTLTYICTPTY
jgi:hypothetical protein